MYAKEKNQKEISCSSSEKGKQCKTENQGKVNYLAKGNKAVMFGVTVKPT